MKTRKQVHLAALLLTGVIGGSAWATPLTFQGQFNVATGLLITPDQGGVSFSDHYGDFMLLNLPSFNSSLGTLNSVSISFASTVFSDMQGLASHSARPCLFIGCEMPTIEASVAVAHHLTLTAHLLNAPSTTRSLQAVQSQDCSYVVTGPTEVTCNANSSPPLSGAFNSAFDLSSYSLIDFIDVSNLFFAFQVESDFNGFCGLQLQLVGQECIVTRTTDWNGTVSVTYDYSDGSGGTGGSGGGSHSVPEPQPLALFAAGLLAIGLARRKKFSV